MALKPAVTRASRLRVSWLSWLTCNRSKACRPRRWASRTVDRMLTERAATKSAAPRAIHRSRRGPCSVVIGHSSQESGTGHRGRHAPEGDHEAGATRHAVLHRHPGQQAVGDLFDHGEADSGAVGAGHRLLTGPVEGLEDLLPLRRRDAGPFVVHGPRSALARRLPAAGAPRAGPRAVRGVG